MESCFSCQSWLSHQPMQGGPCPSSSFAYTQSLPRIPFWFCGSVALSVCPSLFFTYSWFCGGPLNNLAEMVFLLLVAGPVLISKLAFCGNEFFLGASVCLLLGLYPRAGPLWKHCFLSDSWDLLRPEGLNDVELVPGHFKSGWRGLDVCLLKTYQS